MFQQSILVMVGGALGAWLRFFLQQKWTWQLANITVSTLLINILGGALMGALAAYLIDKPVADQSVWRSLFMSGFCGGFTTFSAFSLEMWHLLQLGKPMHAIALALLHVSLALMAVMLAWYVVRGSWH